MEACFRLTLLPIIASNNFDLTHLRQLSCFSDTSTLCPGFWNCNDNFFHYNYCHTKLLLELKRLFRERIVLKYRKSSFKNTEQ